MIILKNNAILREKIPLISSIIAGIIVSICLLRLIMLQTTNADFPNDTYVKTIKVVITAYSSTPDQTDDTPFITASRKHVRVGIIANNILPFGTKIKIPKLYGDQVFIVEDRMNKKKSDYHVDIWFPSKNMAINFGVKTAYIEVLEN